jgi:hypothetical protein
MPADTITPAGAAAPSRPLPCKHILVPGQAHCLSCGAQLFGIERPRWERLLRFIERVADLLGYNSI